jgi:hypothetical protein
MSVLWVVGGILLFLAIAYLVFTFLFARDPDDDDEEDWGERHHTSS